MDHPKVLGYLDVLRDKKPVGKTVAVIGAGGIGFDVSEYLLHEGEPSLNKAKFLPNGAWTPPLRSAWRLSKRHLDKVPRKIYLLQRKTSKGGRRFGQDHRLDPPHRPEEPRRGNDPGATYRKIDDAGLHITVGDKDMTCPWTTSSCLLGRTPTANCRPALEAKGVRCT